MEKNTNNKGSVPNMEAKIARKGFLKKTLAVAAGLGIFPAMAKVFGKTGNEYKSQGNGSGKKVLSMEPFIGEIQLVAFNFTPKGFLPCDGSLLPINQYQALYSLLGTIYGGDGRTTFALPDLRGRVPIHYGPGPGLSNYNIGQTGGSETVTLTTNQIPQHNHSIPVNSGVGTTDTPTGMYIAKNSEGVKQFAATSDNTAKPTGTAGAGQPHNNIQPYCAINYIICVNGIYPQRQ